MLLNEILYTDRKENSIHNTRVKNTDLYRGLLHPSIYRKILEKRENKVIII